MLGRSSPNSQAPVRSPGAAIRRVCLFNALGYLAALAGGGFVGRVLAPPHGAIVGALLLAAGFSVMAAERSMGLLAALALLSAGSGLFRPSITLLLDRLYHRQDGRRDAGHIWFWMAVNIGGALAPLVAGSLRIVAGSRAAFTAGTLSILLCAMILVVGQRYLVATGQPDEEETPREASDEPDAPLDAVKRLRLLIAVGFAMLLYTIAYGQLDGMLLLWARDHTDRSLFGREVPAV